VVVVVAVAVFFVLFAKIIFQFFYHISLAFFQLFFIFL